MIPRSRSWQFWIDRGGTFTDIVARHPDGRLTTRKLLSENPGYYRDAAIAGIKQVLGLALDQPIPRGLVSAVRLGTTVATNALLARAGEPSLLLVNRGFADLLRIGNQARPRLFDLAVTLPSPLYERVVEIPGRVTPDGTEIEPFDETAARDALHHAAEAGLRACAIALIHAWRHPGHERRLAALARESGFDQVSASHEVSPLLRLVPRAGTTVLDAALSPVLRRTVDQLAAELGDTRLHVMQSNGGLAEAHAVRGKDAILSGPAAGVVGAARTAELAGLDRVIGFDMGGTSTDVALYAGVFERTLETEIAGVPVRAPMMAINTIAAGGGSILSFDGARFRVGPESAGADPGPAAYRRGGPLTITDANIRLGKIQPRHFPSLFGPGANQPLDADIVAARFDALARDIGAATGMPTDPCHVAEGFLRVAVANMANAIRQVSVRKGHDPARFALQCFGGAGGQHVCLVAEALGMSTVLLHPLAGVLSAYGIGLAEQTAMREQAVERRLDVQSLSDLEALAAVLDEAARADLRAQGADPGRLRTASRVHLRYEGADASLVIPLAPIDELRGTFTESHRARFGFATPERPLIAETIEVEVTEAAEPVDEPLLASRPPGEHPSPIDQVQVWTDGAPHETQVYDRDDLRAGDRLSGPVLLRDSIATIVVEPGWTSEVTERHILLRRTRGRAPPRTADPAGNDERPDPILLELFTNLFMHVAEQAGIVLRNTARSVNIKERLDFSCALFDQGGNLVANAPHVPVHLGAMGESVRSVLRTRRGTLRPGDVVALNDPAQGGTHLPDVTCVTPVFDSSGQELRFFLASRGHHADIGGLTPGSTPPNSCTLEDEGVVIDDVLLVSAGEFREQAFRALLANARHPARNPDINVADIEAQLAANHKGGEEIERVVDQYGWATVRTYMRHVMDNAEESVRRVIDRLHDGSFAYAMDDGAPLRIAIRVDRAPRAVTIDFTGTGEQHAGNFNAPPAVTRAVVLYVLRCLVADDIPLNDGCLEPVTLIIPPDTFLSPSRNAAVVAGNTEVSQAVCNALLGALGVAASAQATMNNVLFGDATHQYYETVCGGMGAGPGFAGAGAVQTHMTNTRMTDPEILELRHPVRVEEFRIRRGSGGAGQWRGGDGAVRRLRFLAPMTACVVASRRTVGPFGLAGGSDGAPGDQWIDRADGTRTKLTGTDQADLAPGDVLVIHTPGGGGYGNLPV